MGDLDDLYANPEPAAPRPKRSPKPAARAPGMSPDQFAAFLHGEESPESLSKSGMTPDQDAEFRKAWPMANMASKPEAQERAAALNGQLDRLHEYGTRVFSAPKVDKKAREAVEGYYRWLREEQKTEGGEGAATRKLIDKILPTEHDPIAALKGPARQQAADMRDLVDHIRDAKSTTGAKLDELHILTSMLPDPSDTPAAAKGKRAAFANQLEELAQGLPPQFWRAAKRHTVRARMLRGPAEPPAATVPRGTQPGAAQAAPEAEEADPTKGWLKRALVGGATGLSLPVVAALQSAIEPGNLAAGGYEMAGMDAPPDLDRGPGFDAKRDALKDNRARALGMADNAAAEEQEAVDKEEHPIAYRAAGFAGGMADPTNLILGLPAKAAAGLSPALRTILSHTLPGAGAGAIAAQGAGADLAGTLKGAAIGAGVGTALGAGANKLLASPGKNELIAKVANEEGKALKQVPAEIAARKAALETDVFSNPEALKVAVGDKHAAGELGPKLEEWTRTLLQKHNIKPGSKLEKSLRALEDAIDTGDTKVATEQRALWDKAWESSPNFSAGARELKKDIDGLLNVRTVKVMSEGGHGHGPVSQSAANMHPFATLSNSEASAGAKGTAFLHAAGEGMGARAVPALASGLVRKPIAAAKQVVDAALARLYMARKAGDMSVIQQAAEQALAVGAPFSAVQNIAGSLDSGGE